MVSKTIKNQQIKRFKFWLDQSLQEGIQYQHALFQRISTLDYGKRHRLYQQAQQLAQQGADILITYEGKTCNLWVNLQKNHPK
ncbi:MAG: hypothetical protein AAF579_02335 [Cyanobacteria bacterium P01_C01_bin.118]